MLSLSEKDIKRIDQKGLREVLKMLEWTMKRGCFGDREKAKEEYDYLQQFFKIERGDKMWYVYNPYGERVAGYRTEREALESKREYEEHFNEECSIIYEDGFYPTY